jgi:hypothetical protein
VNISTKAREAARAVQDRLGERVPPVRYELADRRQMADLWVSASGYRTEPALRDRYYRHAYWQARTSIGLTQLTPSGILVVLRSDKLRRSPEQLWPTLVHELVHAVQLARPGAADRWLAGELNNLGITQLSRREAREQNRQVDADEREAARIEAELAAR